MIYNTKINTTSYWNFHKLFGVFKQFLLGILKFVNSVWGLFLFGRINIIFEFSIYAH